MPEAAPPPEADPHSEPPERDGLREFAMAWGFGLFGAFAALYALLGGPLNRVIGDWQSADTLGWQWTADWVGQRLASFSGFLHSSAGYAPVGETPLSTLGGAAVAFAAPLTMAFGWPLGVNLYAVLVVAMNAAAGAWLARSVGARRVSALFGGVAFALSPYFIGELSAGRLGQLSAWALVCALAVSVRHFQQPTRQGTVWIAAFLCAASLGYVWYGLMGGLVLSTLALVHVLSARGKLARGWYSEVAGTVAVVSLACLPGIWLASSGMPTAEPDKLPQPLSVEYSLNPGWMLGIDGGPSVPAAVSFVLVAVALVGVVFGGAVRPALRSAVVILCFGWVMSLGPRMLTAGGPIVDSHFPFYFYSYFFPKFTFPYQHLVLVAAGLAALGARGATVVAAWVSRGQRGARVEAAVCLAIAAIATMELSLRGVPLTPRVSHLAAEPEWVNTLRELPEGTMLMLPLAPELRVSQENLVLQRLHKHPTMDGRAAWRDDQRPREWDEMIEASGFLKELCRFERGREIKGDPERANYFRYPVEDVKRLEEHGLRWIVVWDSLYAESLKGLAKNERQLLDKLIGKPAFATKGLTVYDLAAHREDGDLVAPAWRFPEGARPGDGVRRMASLVPPGVFFERGAPTR